MAGDRTRQILQDVGHDDWVRLAAFIDGEGSITIGARDRRGHLALKVQVSNTDIRLMNWLRRFGGSVSNLGVPKKGQKQAYLWITSSLAAEGIVRRVHPFLLLKREQAEVAIAFRETFHQGRNQQERLTPAERFQRQSYREAMQSLNQRGVPLQ